MTVAAPPAAPPREALRVANAKKSFGATHALAGLSLTVREGELLALLGPNGAGKTTLIRAVAGRLRLDAGAVAIFGETLANGRRAGTLGVVPQEIALYPLLTARENLAAWGELHGVPRGELRERIEWALGWTALGERANALVRDFSGGMKRRLNIACGVLHRPKLVLLDEPTVGVDPQSREKIYDMLAALKSEGAALLLTTHQLEEAERRCDRVAIVDHGRLVAEGTVRELLAAHAGRERTVRITTDRAPESLPRGAEWRDGHVEARVADVGEELASLLHALRAAGVAIDDVAVERRGLQDVFLKLTGKELRE